MPVTRHPNGNIEITLSLPWKEIDAELKKQTDLALSKTELPGFRKGKAPRDLVEPKLDKSQLLSHSLSEILPLTYTRAVNENKLKPVLYPRIKIDKGKWGEDFIFTATTCEAPIVTLPEKYQDIIRKISPKSPDDSLPDVLEYLRKNSRVDLPELLIQEETDHRLSHLAENLTSLGMDMGKYLTTKKLSADDLKSQTTASAKADLEVEFIISSIQADRKLADRKSVLDFLKALPKT